MLNPEKKYEIPTLAPWVMALASFSARDEDYFEKVTNVTQGDPALTGMAFRMANSPMYASRMPCATLRRCLLRVGAKTFVSHVMQNSLVSIFKPEKRCGIDYWHHSLIVASVSRLMARNYPGVGLSEEHAFTLGLMHNVGCLVVMHNEKEAYEDIANELKSQYAIAYRPSEPAEPGEWREIEIRANGAKEVRTKPGYYGGR